MPIPLLCLWLLCCACTAVLKWRATRYDEITSSDVLLSTVLAPSWCILMCLVLWIAQPFGARSGLAAAVFLCVATAAANHSRSSLAFLAGGLTLCCGVWLFTVRASMDKERAELLAIAASAIAAGTSIVHSAYKAWAHPVHSCRICWDNLCSLNPDDIVSQLKLLGVLCKLSNPKVWQDIGQEWVDTIKP